METEIRYDRWVIIETTHGTFAVLQEYVGKTTDITASDVSDHIEGRFLSAEIFDGYGVRLSMPGYLDCTEWTVFSTEADAEAYCRYLYDDSDDDRGSEYPHDESEDAIRGE